jgi:hypothetical protein
MPGSICHISFKVMKLGNTIKAIPETIGTVAFCFFPYAKNPRPIAPNTISQISSDVDSILKFKVFKSQGKLNYKKEVVRDCNRRNFKKVLFDGYLKEIDTHLFLQLFIFIPVLVILLFQ